ncbi:hypothetical protein B0H10DRAFT_1945269 [Mycena sp. CBHHK59/15]|nr:hypothetical protein B0H10DRAFT_1945269 [Mycena sp. CBHHK59/15]
MHVGWGSLEGGVLRYNADEDTRGFEDSGIQLSYQSGHPVENMVKNLKRKSNAKIEEAAQKIKKARDRIITTQTALSNPATHASMYEKRSEAVELEKARNAYRKEVQAATTLEATGKGSRLVAVWNVQAAAARHNEGAFTVDEHGSLSLLACGCEVPYSAEAQISLAMETRQARASWMRSSSAKCRLGLPRSVGQQAGPELCMSRDPGVDDWV